VDAQTVNLMPDELCRSSIHCRNNRFAGAPSLKEDDSKRFVPARNTYSIARFVELRQSAVALKTKKPGRMSHAQLAGTIFNVAPHFAITSKYELGRRIEFQNVGNRLDKQIGTLLKHHTT